MRVPGTFVFFFNDTATTEIYTLSLHDALPICVRAVRAGRRGSDRRELHRTRVAVQQSHAVQEERGGERTEQEVLQDRKSTRLNSSHANISYAVFCLKKKRHE